MQERNKHLVTLERIPFVLSRVSELTLIDNLLTFHGLIRKQKCSGMYLEEIVFQSLNRDPTIYGFVKWVSGSHNSKADVIITRDGSFGISIKSGVIQDGNLNISGHRLSKVANDFNKINQLLNTYKSDIILCFAFLNGEYTLWYVDGENIIYPKTVDEWKGVMGKRLGKITNYVWTAENGFTAEIYPSMSWQIWWTIPLTLCRKGFSLKIPGLIQNDGMPKSQQQLDPKSPEVNTHSHVPPT